MLDRVLSSYDDDTRFNALRRLPEEMPEATIIFLDDSVRHPEHFDLYIELSQGRITHGSAAQPHE